MRRGPLGKKAPDRRQGRRTVKRFELPGEPLVLRRGEHNISRKDIDVDALKVMYRLAQKRVYGFFGRRWGAGLAAG